jgi:hypothetical protein
MKLSSSDYIAIAAFFVSLLTFYSQGQSSQKQLLIANISAYTLRYQEIILHLPRSVLNGDFDIETIPEEEQTVILRYMLVYFNLCFEEYTLYFNLKLIDKKLWKIWESGIRSSLAKPAFRQCWEIVSIGSSYEPDFLLFMNKMIRNRTL